MGPPGWRKPSKSKTDPPSQNLASAHCTEEVDAPRHCHCRELDFIPDSSKVNHALTLKVHHVHFEFRTLRKFNLHFSSLPLQSQQTLRCCSIHRRDVCRDFKGFRWRDGVQCVPGLGIPQCFVVLRKQVLGLDTIHLTHL